MGHIHISFEYHVHKCILKIRVWQLSDLLLPPPQISMIQSVYVRSHLIPKESKKTFIRTEEVRVENPEAHINVKAQEQKPLTGIQQIFTPSNFKFLTPMEYTGITGDVVRDQSIQIEVCMIQKTTRKSFLIGMINVPLKKAVKKVVREKIPLIPCLNYTTPNNMRVYSATDLQLDHNGDAFFTSPLLRQLSDGLPPPENGVDAVLVPDESLIKPVHIKNIRLKNYNNNDITPNEADAHKNNSSVNGIQTDGPTPKSELDLSQDSDKKLIKVNLNELEINDIIVSANQLKAPKTGEPDKTAVVSETDKSKQNAIKAPDENKPRKLPVPTNLKIENNNSDMEIDAELPDLNVTSPVPSRPETPVWDYYDFEYEEGVKQKPKNSTSSAKSTSSVSS